MGNIKSGGSMGDSDIFVIGASSCPWHVDLKTIINAHLNYTFGKSLKLKNLLYIECFIFEVQNPQKVKVFELNKF